MRHKNPKNDREYVFSFLEDVVNTFRSAVLVLNGRFHVLLANDSYLKLFQVSHKQILAHCIFSVGGGQWDIPRLRMLLASVLPMKKVFEDFEVARLFPVIGRRVMLLKGRQLKIRIGREPLILLAIDDITEEKAALAALLQTNKLAAIGQLSAGIVHGIGSPLTGVVSFIDAYLREEPKENTRHKELQLVREGCKYIVNIVKNLTDFAAPKRDHFETLDLVDIVNSVLFFTERQLLMRNIKITKEFPEKPMSIRGNRSQLQHAILNIIVNALEAMAHGGKLAFKIIHSADSKGVLLRISDTGKGIKKEYLSKVIEPFFTTKEVDGGAGLGLSIVYGVMKQHKGKLDIESKAGKGTTIVLSFPAQKRRSPWNPR